MDHKKNSSKNYKFDKEIKKEPLYNFQCNNAICKHRFYVTSYIMLADETYLYRNRKHIKCPICGGIVSYHCNQKGFASFMSFASKSKEEKTKLLRERANKHAASKKETDKREYMDRNFKGRALNL